MTSRDGKESSNPVALVIVLMLGGVGYLGWNWYDQHRVASTPKLTAEDERDVRHDALARAVDNAETAKASCRGDADRAWYADRHLNDGKNISVFREIDERHSMQLADCQREFEDALQTAKLLNGEQ
jgi:hypothetical protein